jgi:hypothetical protein
MNHRGSYFGGEMRAFVRLANSHSEIVEVSRDFWFDRDIDGRWLVWASDRDGTSVDGTDGGPLGAIVVRNRDVSAFIELLDRLIAEPAAFEHEPVFVDADTPTDPVTPAGDGGPSI